MAEELLLKTFTAAALAGAQCAVVGVFIFLLNIHFLGVAVSHAAMAGAVWGSIAGVNPKASAMAGALIASMAVGPLSGKTGSGASTAMAVIFSFVMALVFLGVGMLGGSQAITGMLWGNIFFVSWTDAMIMGAMLGLSALFVAFRFREITALFFNREIAASLGVKVSLYAAAIIVFAGAAVAVNIETIGGLMLFGLIIVPPAAAWQLSGNLKSFFLFSSLIGLFSGLIGAAVSFWADVPVGSGVVMAACSVYALCSLFSPKRKRERVVYKPRP